MPENTFLVGYAHDIAAVIEARNPELGILQHKQVMRRVNAWMENHGLHLDLTKTEIVMLTRKRICTITEMRVGSEITETKVSARSRRSKTEQKEAFDGCGGIQLLYGAEIWASALNTAKYRKRITVVQRRGALRVACSNRTVSEAAMLVVAGKIPIDLLAKERKRIFDTRPRRRGRDTDGQTDTS
ncbi:hypothetical protein J437_LFUL013325, partial [Ladona fulva]